jgi:hypothetical protein
MKVWEKERYLWYICFLDVDTPEPDEKSLITYISSLYDAFPEPPRLHPLYDTVKTILAKQSLFQLCRISLIAMELLMWNNLNSRIPKRNGKSIVKSLLRCTLGLVNTFLSCKTDISPHLWLKWGNWQLTWTDSVWRKFQHALTKSKGSLICSEKLRWME